MNSNPDGLTAVHQSATANALKLKMGIPLESTWLVQQEDGRIGIENHDILQPIKMGRDWPVKPTFQY
jgi:hypothetical protein